MRFHNLIPVSALVPALSFGLIQAAAVYVWGSDAVGDGWQDRKLIGLIGGLTFLIGLLLWKNLARKPGGMNAGRGAAAGFLAGLLVHPLFFLVAPTLVALNSWDKMTMADLPLFLGGIVPLSLFSLVMVGLPPLCLCTLAGCFWGRAQA